MTELREFARQSQHLAMLDVRLVPISVDDQQRAREAWEKAANKKFTILSDPGASVIRKYGLLHEHGVEGRTDIALRTTILIGPDGRERWRRVSKAVPDIPSWKETLTQIKAAQASADATELDGQEFRVRELASDSIGNELVSKPRIAVLRSIMFNHWYHHPGQLSVLSSPARRAGPSDIWP